MKFRDGYWGLKSGITLNNPVEVRDIRFDRDSLTVFSMCRQFRHRGDTLNAPMLTTEYSSPLPDIIRVRTFHFKGAPDPGPNFDLYEGVSSDIEISESDEDVSFRSGDLVVRIARKDKWCTELFFRDRYLTGITGKLSGHVTACDGSTYMSEHLTLSVGEYVYGLGERFTPFVKNGQVVDIWNEDGGTSSEQAYKNIPFYLTNRGYGVLVANPGKVSFEVASEVVTSVQFSVPGEFLDYYFIGGGNPKAVLSNYAKLAGRPSLPPAWSFGLWLTTSFTTKYDEETVNTFIDGMAAKNIPLHVFHFDCFWMKEFQWVDFEWDTDQFPDPRGMLKRLKKRGLRICVWINPYIAQKSRLFDEGLENGYLVKKPDGSIWQWDRWQAGMGLVDFTNPEAVAWYKAALRKLMDMGVDTFKTDFGERIPTDVKYSDGSDPYKMHNYYAYLYNKAVFELIEEVKGRHQALVFARSATTGGQKFPVHWGGDCSATYESMAESLRGGLSLALSGFGFWSHDIGGFERTSTPDLFKRWIAFGALSSHSRLHGNESYRVPWYFDDESSTVLKFFIELKCSLMPYIFSQACKTASTGIPILRAMILEFPEVHACSYLDRQYMLGDSLLVAPIFSSEGKVSYYLPEGRWTNFLSGKITEGGVWRTEEHDYFSLPLMVPDNTIIAVGAEKRRPDYDYIDAVCFHLFEITEQEGSTATVYGIDGEQKVEITVRKQGRYLHIDKRGVKTMWSLCLRGIGSVKSVDGGSWDGSSIGAHVSVAADTERVVIQL
jgi:alpha-D-xyloside xylohydrolase